MLTFTEANCTLIIEEIRDMMPEPIDRYTLNAPTNSYILTAHFAQKDLFKPTAPIVKYCSQSINNKTAKAPNILIDSILRKLKPFINQYYDVHVTEKSNVNLDINFPIDCIKIDQGSRLDLSFCALPLVEEETKHSQAASSSKPFTSTFVIQKGAEFSASSETGFNIKINYDGKNHKLVTQLRHFDNYMLEGTLTLSDPLYGDALKPEHLQYIDVIPQRLLDDFKTSNNMSINNTSVPAAQKLKYNKMTNGFEAEIARIEALCKKAVAMSMLMFIPEVEVQTSGDIGDSDSDNSGIPSDCDF